MIWPPGRPKITETFCCLRASTKHLAPDMTVNNITFTIGAQHADSSLLHAGLLNKDNNEERKDYRNAYRQEAKRGFRLSRQISFQAPEFCPYNAGARLISLSRKRTPGVFTSGDRVPSVLGLILKRDAHNRHLSKRSIRNGRTPEQGKGALCALLP